MRRVVLAIVSTIASLVMLLSFKTHSTTPLAATAAVSGTTGDTTPGGSTTSTKKSATTHSASTEQTVTGDAVNTQYGPVQVKITVKNGTLTAVTATEYPTTDPRDAQINAYAIPALTQEALAANSAQIAMISGATYTSNGYITSLQSALDKVS